MSLSTKFLRLLISSLLLGAFLVWLVWYVMGHTQEFVRIAKVPWLNLFALYVLFAAILSFLVVLVCAPGLVEWLRAKKMHGCVDHDSKVLAQMRAKKQDVPTMGGLLILFSVLFSVLLFGTGDASLQLGDLCLFAGDQVHVLLNLRL